MTCKHLSKSEVSYTVEISGEPRGNATATYYRCGWADTYLDRVQEMPRWLQALAVEAAHFDFTKDCEGCPAFETGGEG